ncbi:MAG: histidinol-phosphate transaminase [Polyangia bacterium]
MKSLSPAHIAAIAPYQPGKPIDELRRELGAAWPAEGAVKLASNENPLGVSPLALEAMAKAASHVSRYPDAGSFELRDKLAHHHGIDRDQVIVGSGSNELINLAVQVFCDDGDAVLTPHHQFLCYRLAAETFARPLQLADNAPDFQLSVDKLLAAVTAATKVVFLANPNNPTGAYLPVDEVARLVRELPQEIVLVLDEAYVEYCDAPDYRDALPLLATRDRFILFRTFSKIHGLAGLRIGYGLSHKPLVELMNRVRLPFNVGSVAQAGAMAALDDVGHISAARQLNSLERVRVGGQLERRGFKVFPSQGNFVLVEVPAPFTGATLYSALLNRGVIVRPLAPYRLLQHVRISIGTEAENDRLLDELDVVLAVSAAAVR